MLDDEHINDAIEQAVQAGFWERKLYGLSVISMRWCKNTVDVEVLVSETSTTLVVVPEDER